MKVNRTLSVAASNTLIILTLLFGFFGCISSRSVIEGLAKTPRLSLQDSSNFTTLNAHQQDFLYLSETVRQAHPEPYARWSKGAFDAEKQRILRLLGTDTSSAAFERSLESFLSRLQDTHTAALLPWRGNEYQYPVSFMWIKDTLILASVEREADTSLIGSKVLSFNGTSTAEVFERFKQFGTFENIVQARRTLQFYFVLQSYLREANILRSDTLELSLLARDGVSSSYRTMPLQKPKRVQKFKPNPITGRINRPFRYTILKDDTACYLQWNVMMDLRSARVLSFPLNLLAYPVGWFMGIGYFENMLNDMFEEMAEAGINTLIVDLRGNGGGTSAYGEQLLYYLAVPPNIRTYSVSVKFSPLHRESRPDAYNSYAAQYAGKHAGARLPDSLLATSAFAAEDTLAANYFRNVTNPKSSFSIEPDRNLFRGRTYFLVGDGTYSSAVILSTLIKDNNLFTIVGQPTRGRPSHYGDILSLKLPNSRIVCTVSHKKFSRPDAAKDSEDSLYPDVEIWPRVDDYLNGRDAVFEWVLQDARKKAVSMK